MNRDEIMQLIPHRPPFLWLDQIVSRSDTAILARTHLPANLELFAGHYPAFPVLPGVIQCEMAFQASAVLIATLRRDTAADSVTAADKAANAGRVPVVARVNNTKFRRMVRPGETVDISVTLTDRLKETYYFTGSVSVGGETAARLEFAATMASVG